MDSLEVLARLLSFCTAFSKSTITLYWEVQMVLLLLGWKVDLISFPTSTHGSSYLLGIKSYGFFLWSELVVRSDLVLFWSDMVLF